MLTVTNAWNQRGWDSMDHMLDDDALTDLIGRTFSSLAAMKAAANKAAESYATVEYEMGGRRYRYDGSAGLCIPGRRVPMISEID